jgi:ribosomal protein L4
LKYSVGNGYGGDGGGNGRARVVGDSSGVVKFGGVFHGPRNRLLI